MRNPFVDVTPVAAEQSLAAPMRRDPETSGRERHPLRRAQFQLAGRIGNSCAGDYNSFERPDEKAGPSLRRGVR